MTARIKVLLDGWALIRQPDSPEALHALSLLRSNPQGVEAIAALPGEPPEWLRIEGQVWVLPTQDTPGGRLRWEQRLLPQTAGRLGADLLVLNGSGPPLYSAVPVLLSPAGYDRGKRTPGMASRLREALAAGGSSRLSGMLWPGDLPTSEAGAPVYKLPPVSLPGFSAEGGSPPEGYQALQLPEGYVLYHGPHEERALHITLEAWSWAAGSIGQAYPLVAAGVDVEAEARLMALAGEYGVGDTVLALPPVRPDWLPWLYRGSQAVFHPLEEPPWAGAGRLAMASGVPLAAADTPRAGALAGTRSDGAGPAAYLAKEGDARSLGAALLTVVVEEGLAEDLRTAARRREAEWQAEPFCDALQAAYERALGVV